MIAFKFLRKGGFAFISKQYWPLPADDTPGAWIEARDYPLDPCRYGVHACRVEDLPYWMSDELWEVELDGDSVRGPQAVVAQRGRLLRRVEAWNSENAQAFGNQCASRARARLASSADGDLKAAAGFANEAVNASRASHHVVAAYAACLTCAVLAPSHQSESAFHAERYQQAQLLAKLLGI